MLPHQRRRHRGRAKDYFIKKAIERGGLTKTRRGGGKKKSIEREVRSKITESGGKGYLFTVINVKEKKLGRAGRDGENKKEKPRERT